VSTADLDNVADSHGRSQSTPPVLLSVRDLRKSFGDVRAVDGLSFEVREGETLGIAGPNGAGKSTLFNLITRIPFGPDAGEVSLAGRSLTGMPASAICRLGVARTFQTETAFESLSVYDNVRVACAYGGGASRRALLDRVGEALDFAGLAEHRDDPVEQLSLVQRKQLMVASALATAPRLLLLDEPASGLTEPEQEQLKESIVRVRARGITVVVVEHVLPLLKAVADRILILAVGRLLAEGAPDAIFRDPRVIEAYVGSRQPQ
jgi:branched-chain amino acid transport system ATP-binding protein